MMKKIFILLLPSLVFISCSSRENQAGESAEIAPPIQNDVIKLTRQQEQNAAIETQVPGAMEMNNILKVNGSLEAPPHQVVSVSMPMGGFVRQISLIPGTRVKKGAVLAVLEDQQYVQLQQDYLTARSKVKFLRADYERQKLLNQTKAASDKVFQQVQHEFESQEIQLRSLGEKLKLIGIAPEKLTNETISRSVNIYSPLSGFVTKVNVNAGRYVSATDVICEIVDPKRLHLSLTVFEQDAARLQRGQRVFFYTNNDTAHKRTATVHLINPDVDQERTIEVHCDVNESSSDLLPGMFINAEVSLSNEKVIAVPEDAVVNWLNNRYVFVKEDSATYRMTKVETGTQNKGYIEILSLPPGREIVTANAYTLLTILKNDSDEG